MAVANVNKGTKVGKSGANAGIDPLNLFKSGIEKQEKANAARNKSEKAIDRTDRSPKPARNQMVIIKAMKMTVPIKN